MLNCGHPAGTHDAAWAAEAEEKSGTARSCSSSSFDKMRSTTAYTAWHTVGAGGSDRREAAGT